MGHVNRSSGFPDSFKPRTAAVLLIFFGLIGCARQADPYYGAKNAPPMATAVSQSQAATAQLEEKPPELTAAQKAARKKYHSGDFKSAPVVFKSGKWGVKRNLDSMTDEVRCVALYNGRFDIQLSRQQFSVGAVGRGGVDGYQWRVDDAPATRMILANKIERATSHVMLEKPAVEKIVQGARFRILVMTLLGGMAEEDLDLTGIKEAYRFINSSECY